MKVLVIDSDGSSLDMCLRAQEAGHQVRLFVCPKKGGETRRVGEGWVHRIDNWRGSMAWADLVFLTGNDRYMNELEPFKKRGFPIFSPGVQGARLEIDRAFGQKILKMAGIDCIPYTEFTDYDTAMKFVAKTERRYVSKTLGDEEDKSLSYVSKSPEDMIFMLDRWKRLGKNIGRFMLQEFVPGVEIGVSGWFGPGGWSEYKNENFEHKKLMNGDKGVNTGEMGCYSADSEVLTDSGWKFWPDVTAADKIASLVDGKTVFQSPSAVVNFDYVGPMVCWKNQTIDICVTPNHNMYVNRQHAARAGRDEYEFLQADQCTQSRYEVLRTAGWTGQKADFHEIPGYTYAKGRGSATVPPINVPAVAWARFLGLYIAEGSTGSGFADIAQSHVHKADKAEAMLLGTGLPYIRTNHGFRINRAQIANHLKPLGRAWEKRVPAYIKDGSVDVISAFLEGYGLGDGNMQANGFRVFYTCNRELAGDVQELLLKIGRVGVVKMRAQAERRNVAPDGHMIIQQRPAYEVIERVQKTRSWLDSRDRTEEMYAGKVYCATVPGHVMYVRRNGKPVWCGNTVMKYVKDSKLFEVALEPVTDYLLSIDYVGDIDMNCMVDSKGKAWPLEFTCRPGWPAFRIMQACHKGDPVQWMLDLIKGENTLKVNTDVAIGVVMAQPDFPYSNATGKEVTGIPIFGTDKVPRNQISPADMMIGKVATLKNGRVAEAEMPVTCGDYVIVCTGTGPTVTKAKEAAYKIVDKITFPNSPMYRTDIGDRLEKQLPELQKHGYATEFVF